MSCGNPHEVDCSEVLNQVYAYLDGEVVGEAAERIRQHLAECAPCLSEFALDLAMKALVKRSCGGDCAPEGLRARIMIQITEVRSARG